MSRVLLAVALASTVGLYGCGAAPSADAADGAEQVSAAEAEGSESEAQLEAASEPEPEEPSGPELREESFDDVMLVSDEYADVSLQGFSQKQVNWMLSDGSARETTLNIISIKAANKTDGDVLVFVHAYLDGEELWCMQGGGDNDPKAGTTVNAMYYIGKDTQPDFSDLDSFDDLYRVDLVITVASNEGGYPTLSETEINLGEAIGR